MQLACIFDNLETQEWHNQDKIFIEKQKNLPKIFARGRRKYLKREKKTLDFSPRRVKIWPKKDKSQFLKREKIGYFEETGLSIRDF